MSARSLSRERGVTIVCDDHDCDATHHTALIFIRANRAVAKKLGWGRGGGEHGNHSKRRDLCPKHAPPEAALVRKRLRELAEKRTARIAARDAKRKKLVQPAVVSPGVSA